MRFMSSTFFFPGMHAKLRWGILPVPLTIIIKMMMMMIILLFLIEETIIITNL